MSKVSAPDVATAVRTLFVSGFSITEAVTSANQLEIRCERKDSFGNAVKYVFALTSSDAPPRTEISALADLAKAENRILVPVAAQPGSDHLGWQEFMGALGGAVPSWRALDKSYENILTTSSKNEEVPGFREQPWAIFEAAVADGFEFMFGIRVIRLGGLRRGVRVSDIIAQTPDDRVLVIDAKASREPYEVSTDTQRALAEYVKDAKTHQKGANSVGAAVVVASQYAQTQESLLTTANTFLSNTQVPLSFITVEGLLETLKFCQQRPELRAAVRWAHIFCQVGLVPVKKIREEFSLLQAQRHGK